MELEMTKIGHSLAFVALMGAMPLQAASDPGLMLHDTGIGQRNTGVGATVGIRIQLGSDRVVQGSERLKLNIEAGPVIVSPDATAADGVRRGQASFVGFDLRPRYSTSLNFAGRPIATDYTRLGAAEKEKDGKDDDKQNTGDKIGWVAAVAGGVMVALVGAWYIACNNGRKCND